MSLKPLSSKQIVQIRKSFGLSQSLFAHVLNVSANAVRSWEQGSRRPTSAALKLLYVAKEFPELLIRK